MKRFVLLSVVLLLTVLTVFASPFTVSDSELKLYDAKGKEMPLNDEVANMITGGWIIKTGAKPILVTTPVGSVLMQPSTTMVTNKLDTTTPSLYLVDGEASFATEADFQGTLHVSTPVSTFTLGSDTKVLITSTEDKETITSFKGNAEAVNGLSGKTVSVDTMKLYDFRQDTIDDVTEENTPSLASYKVNEKPAVIAPIPEAPTSLKEASVKPVEAKAPIFVPGTPNVEGGNATVVPPMPQIVSAQEVALESVTGMEGKVRELQTMFVITVTPMTPKSPSFKPTKIRVMPVEPNAGSIENATQMSEQQEKAEAKQQTTLTTKVTKQNKYGISFSLEGRYDKDNDYLLQLSVTPFIETRYFAMKVKTYVKTNDFKHFISNCGTFDSSSAYAIIGDIFDYIDMMRIGMRTSPVYFSIAKGREHTEGGILVDESSLQSETKNAYLRFRFGGVRIGFSMQDVSLKNLRNELYSYEHLSFSYIAKTTPIVSVGALIRTRYSDDMQSYPYLNLNIPLVDTRSFRLSLVADAATFLPLLPKMDSTKVFSDGKFQNYLIGGGFTMGFGDFSFTLQAGAHKGESYPSLYNAFTFDSGNTEMTKYESTVDLKAKVNWENETIKASVSYSQPLSISAGKANRSKLSTNPLLGADLLTIDLSLNFGKLSIITAYEIYGVGETKGWGFVDGDYTLLSVGVGYKLADDMWEFELGARKKAEQYHSDNTFYGYLTATYNLQGKF